MHPGSISSSLLLLWLPALSHAAAAPKANITDGCSNVVVGLIEKYYHADSIQDLAEKMLGKVQGDCASNSCPRVDVASSCKQQSLDNIDCEMKNIFSTKVKLGTDDICDAGCNDWPCKASCDGIDVAICKGSDWILCKAGCLGIHSCVSKCEHAIVDPCKKTLIKKCSDKCEVAFGKCEAACKSKLTLAISGDFERLQHVISSMKVSNLNVNCSGNGVTDALRFQVDATISITSAALSIKVHTLDAGISTTNNIDLQNIAATLAVPLSGSLTCATLTVPHDARNISIKVGQPAVTGFNLDVDLKLDKTLATIASVACVGLPFCKDAIKKEIAKTIEDEVKKNVPRLLASQLQPVLEKATSNLQCPKIAETDEDTDKATLVV